MTVRPEGGHALFELLQSIRHDVNFPAPSWPAVPSRPGRRGVGHEDDHPEPA